MSEKITKSEKFDNAVGKIVGKTIRTIFIVYIFLTIILGLSVIAMGTTMAIKKIYLDYGGMTLEGLFWIANSAIGIILLAVTFARYVWLDLTNR